MEGKTQRPRKKTIRSSVRCKSTPNPRSRPVLWDLTHKHHFETNYKYHNRAKQQKS